MASSRQLSGLSTPSEPAAPQRPRSRSVHPTPAPCRSCASIRPGSRLGPGPSARAMCQSTAPLANAVLRAVLELHPRTALASALTELLLRKLVRDPERSSMAPDPGRVLGVFSLLMRRPAAAGT